MSNMYKQAGVDVHAGYKSVELIKKHIQRTMIPGVLGGIGSFSGLFELDLSKYPNPVLVSGTDGVGTKLKLAHVLDIHDTIGIDAVAMCVNDIICQGADPLFFLDYIACGKNYPEIIEQIVKGVADGCNQSECALVGGETAEMPGFYKLDEYDIAGFCVGAVNKPDIISGEDIHEGDVLLGLPSSGVHSNGFSLVRKIFGESKQDLDKVYPGFDQSIGRELITPTRIYVRDIKRIKALCNIKGISHITGGGFIENIPRLFAKDSDYTPVVQRGTWEVPKIFQLMAEKANISKKDMYNTFNMGIGMVVVLSEQDANKILNLYTKNAEQIFKIGYVAKRNETQASIDFDVEENIVIK